MVDIFRHIGSIEELDEIQELFWNAGIRCVRLNTLTLEVWEHGEESDSVCYVVEAF